MDRQNFEHIRAMLQALKISAVFHPSVEFIRSRHERIPARAVTTGPLKKAE